MNEQNAEKQLYVALYTIRKSQQEMEEALITGETIMDKVSPRPAVGEISEPNELLAKEPDLLTLLEGLVKLSSENRSLAHKLNNLITWMDKTF